MDTSSSSSTYEDQPQATPILYQPYLPEPAMQHPTATLEESATYSRLILIDYLHRINNAVGDIHPSFELVRVDTLSIIRIHCTRVNTTPYHDGLAFSPRFFEPMGREVLATHREVHPGEPVYSDSVAPWPAWPRQGEIERIENNREDPIAAVASTGIIFLSARCFYRTTFTPASKRERDLVRRARYTQERVHRILNVLRNVRPQPSFDRAPGGSVAVSIPGTLRDVANAYTCHRTAVQYACLNNASKFEHILSLHPDFLTYSTAGLKSPVECNGMVELDGSGQRRVPYGNVVPIRIGVDAATPGQETLSIGEIRVAIRAILFTISVPRNDDQWLIPVLVIAYLGHNRGRIIQAHAQINRDNGRGELIMQYSPLFDFSQEPALNSLFALYTLATPILYPRVQPWVAGNDT